MKRKLIYALALLQIFGLIGLYLYNDYALKGETYLLRTEPVDPRDLLRGDYIILSYQISRVPEEIKDQLPAQLRNSQGNRDAYVTLRADDEGFWVIDRINAHPPKTTDGPVLKAQIRNNRLYYDIENFFVAEGKGNPPGIITVDITVAPDRTARIKTLYSDGTPWQ